MFCLRLWGNRGCCFVFCPLALAPGRHEGGGRCRIWHPQVVAYPRKSRLRGVATGAGHAAGRHCPAGGSEWVNPRSGAAGAGAKKKKTRFPSCASAPWRAGAGRTPPLPATTPAPGALAGQVTLLGVGWRETIAGPPGAGSGARTSPPQKNKPARTLFRRRRRAATHTSPSVSLSPGLRQAGRPRRRRRPRHPVPRPPVALLADRAGHGRLE